MSCQNGKPAFNVFRYLKKRCTMTPPSRTPGDTDQHQLFRKRHPRLRHEKKNLRRDRQRQGPRCARHHAGACQNLHEVEIVVLRIHRRPPRHPRAKNPAPRKPHPASPRINPTSLAREFAPFTPRAWQETLLGQRLGQHRRDLAVQTQNGPRPFIQGRGPFRKPSDLETTRQSL